MEAEFIAWLAERATRSSEISLGIGDDAALIDFAPGRQCVVTTDMLMEGVDFRFDSFGTLSSAENREMTGDQSAKADRGATGLCTFEEAGRKSLAVNLSDLAAMAARPVAAFVSLALPRANSLEIAKRLVTGMLPLAEQFGVSLAGGDTNVYDGPLVVNVTLLGETLDPAISEPWRRRGAQPGDAIVVTGAFGGSILEKHWRFVPRVHEAIALAKLAAEGSARSTLPGGGIHAAIDVSDGLSLDLWRLAQASGCGAELDLSLIPLSEDAFRLAKLDGNSPCDHALGDGEDFELILAIEPNLARDLIARQPLGAPLTQIGVFVKEPGLWLKPAVAGSPPAPLSPRGFLHG